MSTIAATDQDLTRRIRDALARALELPPEAISPAAGQGALEKWDSLGHLSVVMELEAEFGTSFSTDQAIAMRSIPQITAIVKQMLHAR